MTSLFDNIFDSYAYSYPHKHSYRKLEPQSLQSLWKEEKKDALFLYLHIPFCEMRCGFCNLFTIANPQNDMAGAYLQALEREAQAVRESIQPEQFAQMAVGGGTPTYLNIQQLEKLFAIIRSTGAEPQQMPVSFEMSPKTITAEKAAFLLAQGVDRVSMGIQSFVETEQKALGRPQKNKEVYDALDLLKQHAFATINIDLIYGTHGQTLDSWLYSVQQAIDYAVEEVFIYPLYVRPLTGITKTANATPADNRPLLYQAARQLLIEAGYEQVSMRMFRRPATGTTKATLYTCQEDGMVGLGAGARSYTKAVHYSSEYAVARHNIRSIIDQYIAKSSEDFTHADYGIILNTEEQQRRFVIKSLLHSSGLPLQRYQQLYGASAMQHYPQLQQLITNELAVQQDNWLHLTPSGIGYSDAIGPWLYSSGIRSLIDNFSLQ